MHISYIEKDESLTISQYTLKEMMTDNFFNCSNENNKLMTGELFEIKDNCLKIVSLDGHRICYPQNASEERLFRPQGCSSRQNSE